MTSISSSLTSSQYQYKSTLTLASVSDADDFSDSSSSSSTTSASTAASTDSSSTEDQSLITAAQTLLSQMMMMMLDGQSSDSSNSSTSSSGSVATTASSTDQTSSSTSTSSDPISAMDTNGDGSVSEAEFVAARPSDVSTDQASSLFESFDSDNTGSLTDDQLSQDMQANGPPPPPQGTQPSDSDLSDIFTSMDTNGDGAVSEAEFVAARPSDLSEDQASGLFDSLDTSQSGSLSESQFASSVKAELSSAQQPPQMPDFSSLFSAGFSDSTTEDLLSL
jgi:Ca2+-binding EF-hand superfamily protein